MVDAFDSETTNVMSRVLAQALGRLKSLGLVDGDADAATSALTKRIMEALETGERNEERLVLFAIGRFHPGKGAPGEL